MAAELRKFGFVMLVVMLGFVMYLYALLRHVNTYGETWLNMFTVILGEVGLFEEFSDDSYSSVATVLLVVYLLVITIMLLSFLIAVLSTAHARVQEKAEEEFKVSTARLIQHYRLAVEEDIPPPHLT